MRRHQIILCSLVITIGFTNRVRAESIPLMIPHSGTVSASGTPINGPGQFKFAIINKDGCGFQTNDGCITHWSNDGTSLSGSEPTNSVQVTVNNGTFALKMGDTRLTNMQTIPTDVFNNSETYLRVWFKDPNTPSGFERLVPDRQLVSVPYTYRAEVANEVKGSNLVTSNTNVGIGTTSPSTNFHFVGDQAFFVGNATNGIATMDVNNGGNGPIALFRGNGNVGIETTNPNSPLDIKGRLEVGTGVRGATLSSTVSDNFQLRTWTNTPNPNFRIEAGDGAGGGSNTVWIEGEGTTLRLLKNGGNVGIGTANPSNSLHVKQSDGNVIARFETTLPRGNGWIQTSIPGRSYLIGVRGDETDNFTIWDNTALIDRLSITTAGNIGIGTATPSVRLEVVGDIKAANFPQNSDIRYKTNISPLSTSLDKVLHLRGVNFDWMRDKYPDLNFRPGRQVGLIAQEVKEVLPEVVFEDSQGMQSVAYSAIIPLLIEAIKEQQQIIEDLKNKLSDVDELKIQVRALRAMMHPSFAEIN